MLFFVCCTVAIQLVLSDTLLAPRSLEVNFRSTHEEYPLSERRHLPIIEVFKHDSTVKLPLFSWKIYNDDDGDNLIYNISQKSYEIELYHEYDLSDSYDPKRKLIWKSDKILSGQHFSNINHLNDEHQKLKNILSEYKWQILSFRVRVDCGRLTSSWSKYGRFILTSSIDADWNNASYIAQETSKEFNVASPMFSKSFPAKSGVTISSGIISVVGLGFFRLYINNNDILELQKPSIYQVGGWTNTKFRVPYASFDVTSYLLSSNNINVYLGEGYRNMSAYNPRDGSRSKNDPIDCILKLQLIIKYSDGTQSIIISDKTWNTYTSSITISSIYNGETYDETASHQSMTLTTVVGPPGVLYPTVQPYVSIARMVTPLDNIYPLSSRNSQIVDFGVNNAGIVRINVANLGLKKGDMIHMKFAEIKQHPPYGPVNGELYYDNLRSAQQYDTFISSGNSTGYWQPFFTMHGFQYMEVWGYPRTLTTKDVTKLEIYSNLEMRSNWTSSDAVLNSINQHCINGQLSNLKSVPTDCNQRDERLGWMGDAALTSNSFCINFNMKSFIENYLILITDEQDKDGSIPDVVPYYRYGGRPSDPNWGLAYPQNINTLYQYYGDSMMDIIKQYMQYNLPLYIDNLQSRMPKQNGKDNIAKYPASYGDWVPPPPNPKISNNFAGAFGYIETVRIIKNFATLIGNSSYETYLNTLQSTLTSEFISAFYNANNGYYLNNLQTSYAMAFEAELYSSSAMKTTLQNNLLKLITTDNNLLTTGIIGTKFILPELHNMNQTQLTLNLIKGVPSPAQCDSNQAENSNAILICESIDGTDGIINKIVFASYGTPTGSCGNNNFQIDSQCNNNQTMNIVSNLCLGKHSCTIPVNNDEFKYDPCYGTKKYLDVRVECGKGNASSQVNASYPSWAFETENDMEPASAVWELWDAENEGPGMNSRNHHMYSSVSAYLNQDISGIKNILYNHWYINIAHLKSDELKWSQWSTDNGLVSFKWKWINKYQLNIDLNIPIGNYAHLHFKLDKKWRLIQNDERNLLKKEWILIDGYMINEDSFINEYDAKMDDDGILMVGSGHYKWSVVI